MPTALPRINAGAAGPPSSDADAFDWPPFSQPLVNLDANIGGYKIYDSGDAPAAIASFDVLNITQAFQHLRVLARVRSDQANPGPTVWLRANNDAGNNYDWGLGSAIAVGVAGIAMFETGQAPICNTGAPAGDFSLVDFTLLGYVDPNQFKDGIGSVSSVNYNGLSNAGVFTKGGRWKSNAAINRLTLIPAAGLFTAGSRLLIYGVA